MKNIKSLDYIVTASHYSTQLGSDGSVHGYHEKICQQIRTRRGINVTIKNPESVYGDPVRARIWQGQWIADCPTCNGAEFVSPDEPIFFCFGCGNRANDNQLRAVIFPDADERMEIERLILERPVDDMAGLSDLERAGLAKPMIVVAIERDNGEVEYGQLGRSWNPGETADDLRKQNIPIAEWLKLSNIDKQKPFQVEKQIAVDKDGE